MFIKTLNRCGLALFLAAIVSGCSLLGSGSSGHDYAHERVDHCKSNRSKCLYEGAYEAGERAYAEQQAKRLNQAAIERLRRSASM